MTPKLFLWANYRVKEKCHKVVNKQSWTNILGPLSLISYFWFGQLQNWKWRVHAFLSFLRVLLKIWENLPFICVPSKSWNTNKGLLSKWPAAPNPITSNSLYHLLTLHTTVFPLFVSEIMRKFINAFCKVYK